MSGSKGTKGKSKHDANAVFAALGLRICVFSAG